MFTALSNWRFFPASSIRVFSSRVYTRVRARGRRRSSSLSLCVERHPRLWMCACPHLLASSYVRPGAGTRVDIFTERSGVPKFFYFRVALSSYCRLCRGSCRRFSFFLCVKFQKLFCTFKKDKTLGLGFKVTRGLARFGRRRRRRALDDDDATWHHHHHLASSSSSSFARTEQTVEAWRSNDRNIYGAEIGGQIRVAVYVFQKLCTKKKNI